MTVSSEPRRGEVWLTAFGKARDGEPGKHRPAVVVSADALLSGAARELVVVVPLSSTLAGGSAVRPAITAHDRSGLDSDSVANCAALRGVSKDRLLQRLGVLSDPVLAGVDKGLRVVLALT